MQNNDVGNQMNQHEESVTDTDCESEHSNENAEHSESENDDDVRQQEFNIRYKDKPPVLAKIILQVFVSALVGFSFGFVMEKARAFEPAHIQGQMVCGKLILLKLIMAAVSSGMLVLSLLAMIPMTHGLYTHACIRFYGQLSNYGVCACLFGGMVMGAGMTVAGSGPELVWVQLGAGVPNAGYIIVGAFLGTLAYGLLQKLLLPVTSPFLRSSTNPWLDVSYFITALPLMGMFAMMVLSFEILIPWENEYKKHQLKHGISDGLFTSYVWSPMVCGVIIGLLQLPMVVGLQHTLGGELVFALPWDSVWIGPLSRFSSSFHYLRLDYKNFWQIIYTGGIVYGAYYSASLSNASFPIHYTSTYNSIIGGFLLAFGVFMCGGSISTHGISGMNLLSILSFITMVGVYGGGLMCGSYMKYHKTLVQGAYIPPTKSST